MNLYIWTDFLANFHYYGHSGCTLASSKALAIANIMRELKFQRIVTNQEKVRYDAIEAYMNANDPNVYTDTAGDYILVV